MTQMKCNSELNHIRRMITIMNIMLINLYFLLSLKTNAKKPVIIKTVYYISGQQHFEKNKIHISF